MPDHPIPTTFSSQDVEIVEQQTVFKGYFRIDRYTIRHRHFDGSWSKPFTREVFERGHAAAALLYDPNLNKIVLIEQFRIGVLGQTNNPWLIELVAGIIEPGETIEEVVRREIQEEAGLIATDLIPIVDYWVSPGGTSEKVSLFCARIDAKQAVGIYGLKDEDEDIRVLAFDAKEIDRLLAEKKVCNAATIIALQWFQRNEKTVRETWLRDQHEPR